MENTRIVMADLLKKQFTVPHPIAPVKFRQSDPFSELPEPPPFINAADSAEAERMRKLLSKRFDVPAPEQSPQPQPDEKSPERAERKPPSVSTEPKSALPVGFNPPNRMKQYEMAIIGLIVVLFVLFCFSVFKMIQSRYLHETIVELQQQVNVAAQTSAKLSRQLEEAQGDLNSTHDAVKSLTEGKAAAQSALNAAEGWIARLTDDNKGLTLELTSLTSAHQAIVARLKEANTLNALLAEQLATAQNDNDRLEKSKAALVERLAEFAMFAETLKTQLNDIMEKVGVTMANDVKEAK